MWQSAAMQPDTATRDEAQRTLERKALRNVRNLVDKLEDDTRREARLTRRFAIGSILVALAVAVVVYFVMAGGKQQHAPIDSHRDAAPRNSPGR